MEPIHVAVLLTRQRSVIIKTCLLLFQRINGGKDLRLLVSRLSCSCIYFNTYWGLYFESMYLLISVGSINQKACRSCCQWQKCITSIQKTLQGMLLFFSCWHQNVFLAWYSLYKPWTFWRNVIQRRNFSAPILLFYYHFISLVSARSFGCWTYTTTTTTTTKSFVPSELG